MLTLKHLSPLKLQTWYDEAWSQLGFFILQSLTIWAKEGNISDMNLNIYLFSIDLCVKMCELSLSDGLKISLSNVSFIFEDFVEQKMSFLCKHYKLNAMRAHAKKIQQQ